MARGKFISFEGIDGAGKSTHVASVAEQLRVTGHTVVSTREPGGTSLRPLVVNSEPHLSRHVPTCRVRPGSLVR